MRHCVVKGIADALIVSKKEKKKKIKLDNYSSAKRMFSGVYSNQPGPARVA